MRAQREEEICEIVYGRRETLTWGLAEETATWTETLVVDVYSDWA